MTAENRLRNAGWGPQRAQELARSMADLNPRQQHAIVNMALAKPMKRSSARPLPGQRDRVQKRIEAARAQNVQTISKAMGTDTYDRDAGGRFAVRESRGTQAQALDPRPPAQTMQQQLRNPFLDRLGNKSLANPYRNQFESLRPQQDAIQADSARWENLRAQGQQPNWELLKAPKTVESFQQAMEMDDRFKQLGEKLATGEAFRSLQSTKDAERLFESPKEMRATAAKLKKDKQKQSAKKQAAEKELRVLEEHYLDIGTLLNREQEFLRQAEGFGTSKTLSWFGQRRSDDLDESLWDDIGDMGGLETRTVNARPGDDDYLEEWEDEDSEEGFAHFAEGIEVSAPVKEPGAQWAYFNHSSLSVLAQALVDGRGDDDTVPVYTVVQEGRFETVKESTVTAAQAWEMLLESSDFMAQVVLDRALEHIPVVISEVEGTPITAETVMWRAEELATQIAENPWDNRNDADYNIFSTD